MGVESEWAPFALIVILSINRVETVAVEVNVGSYSWGLDCEKNLKIYSKNCRSHVLEFYGVIVRLVLSS